jgi:hypothetical protein
MRIDPRLVGFTASSQPLLFPASCFDLLRLAVPSESVTTPISSSPAHASSEFLRSVSSLFTWTLHRPLYTPARIPRSLLARSSPPHAIATTTPARLTTGICRHARVRTPRSAPHPGWASRPELHLPGFSALFATSPARSHFSRGFPAPATIRPQVFATSRRFHSALGLAGLFHPAATSRVLPFRGFSPRAATLPHREELAPRPFLPGRRSPVRAGCHVAPAPASRPPSARGRVQSTGVIHIRARRSPPRVPSPPGFDLSRTAAAYLRPNALDVPPARLRFRARAPAASPASSGRLPHGRPPALTSADRTCRCIHGDERSWAACIEAGNLRSHRGRTCRNDHADGRSAPAPQIRTCRHEPSVTGGCNAFRRPIRLALPFSPRLPARTIRSVEQDRMPDPASSPHPPPRASACRQRLSVTGKNRLPDPASSFTLAVPDPHLPARTRNSRRSHAYTPDPHLSVRNPQ